MYWFCRGSIALGHRLAVKALAHPANKDPTADRCVAVIMAGQLCGAMGRHEEARRHGEEALQIAVTLGNDACLSAARRLLGMAMVEQGDWHAARGQLEEAVELARKSGRSRIVSMSLNHLADLHRVEGDLKAAGSCYEEALVLDRERGTPADVASNLCGLAITLIGRNSVESAFPLLREALAITLESGTQYAGHLALEVAAGLAAVVGEWTYAARLNAAVEAHSEQTQRRPAIARAPQRIHRTRQHEREPRPFERRPTFRSNNQAMRRAFLRSCIQSFKNSFTARIAL